MTSFRDMLSSDETLFRNDVALEYDYIPKLVPHRENEQRTIAACIRPLLQQQNGRNLIITGSPGVGKTVICKKVVQALDEEEQEGIIPIYINCWQRNTTFKVMADICEKLGHKFIQNKKTDDLFNLVKQTLNKASTVIIFDEVDKMEEYDFLYMMLEGLYRKTIILITNYKDWINDLDSRIKSRLTPELIEFNPYNFDQTKDILQKRKDVAFYEGVWTTDVFEIVAKKTTDIQDVRAGLHLMKEATHIAEDDSSRKVLKKHVEKAIGNLNEFTAKKTEDLDEETKKVLEIAKSNTDKKIGDLYKIYQEKGGKANYKTFQRKINKLAEDKFISVEKKKGGAEGTTTIIKKLTDF